MVVHTKKQAEIPDPGDVPAYTIAEAARYVRLPVATLRSWVVGRPYPRAGGVAHFQPLIRPASGKPAVLSFWNLIEAHVLRSLRTEHDVSLRTLRKALTYAERDLSIERLLLSKELRAHAGKVLLEHYGKLIDLSASGQLAMRRMFEEHLERVDWGSVRLPIRLFPYLSSRIDSGARPILIDPRVAFGRPIVARRGISTQAIVDRIDAGESVQELALDYDLAPSEVEEAVLYERAA